MSLVPTDLLVMGLCSSLSDNGEATCVVELPAVEKHNMVH